MKQKNVTEFIRVEKNKDYTVIHNEFLRRKDLSWKAKGILAYILSLPDDWNINLKELMQRATDGEASFRSGWKELSDTGYVKRKPVRDKQRIRYWETIVYESVDTKRTSLLVDFQDVENLNVDNQDVENHNLLSTDSTKYLKELSTNKDHSPTKVEQIPYKKIIDYLNEQTGRKYSHSANKNQDLIRARWNEGFRLEDFKRVIDNKVVDAKNPNHLFKEAYLRPATLFSNKFDGYLNEGVKVNKNSTPKPNNYIDDWSEFEEMLE